VEMWKRENSERQSSIVNDNLLIVEN